MRLEDWLLKSENKTPFSILDDNGLWSWDVLRQRAQLLARSLKKVGVKSHDKVAVICENSAQFMIGIFGSLSADASVVLLDPQLPSSAVEEMLHGTDVHTVCTYGSRSSKMAEIISSGQKDAFCFLHEEKGDWEQADDFFQESDEMCRNTNETAFIMFSSGTSGKANGVMLSHTGILNNANAIIEYMNPTVSDSFYIAKTMVHISSLTGELIVALMCGSKVIAKNPVVSPQTTLRRIELLKPTILIANPTLFNLLADSDRGKYDLSSVRFLYTCGAPAGAEVLKRIAKAFRNAKVMNLYGLTEAGPRVTAQRDTDDLTKYGSTGRPIQGVEVRICDEAGKEVAQGNTGEIYVKSNSLMQGYYNNSALTAERFSDGWLKTGDIGYVDKDNEVFVLGRKDDIINRAGHNIDPRRIEQVVCKVPGIKDCLAFGIPDPKKNTIIICLIIEEEKMHPDRQLLWETCRKMLAPYENPQVILKCRDLPKTSGGKVSRKMAVAQYIKKTTNQEWRCFDE